MLVGWIGSHYQEAGCGFETTVAGAGRKDRDVAASDKHFPTSGSAQY
jgi:hypothetical protein